MINVLLTGVGGQGTVLAAKVLAEAARSKGWKVRAAETIGMAQRGGSVISHVRMGNDGEDVRAPLITVGTADLVIAFEPGEAARVLPYLAKDGVLVTATTPLQPVAAALSHVAYSADDVIHGIEDALIAHGCSRDALVAIDDASILAAANTNRKALNTVLLACAIAQGRIPVSVNDLKAAVTACVKPRFKDMNLAAVDAAAASISQR